MNMLNKKFNHNRLREKPESKNKVKVRVSVIKDKRMRSKPSMKNKSKEIKIPEYLSYLHEVLLPPCFHCGTMQGIQMHHIKEASSDIKDDRFVIPLCYEHHLGLEFSAHGTPVDWRNKYSFDKQSYAAQKLYEGWKK